MHRSRVELLVGLLALGSWGCGTPSGEVQAKTASVSQMNSGGAVPMPDAGWPMYNRTYDGVRSSPLRQIALANVGNLRPVCRVKLGEEGTFQSGPVVFGDTLVITTAHSTAALHATTCKQIWRHADTVSALDVAAYVMTLRATPAGRSK